MKLKHKFSIVALALASFASIGNAKADWEINTTTGSAGNKICILTDAALESNSDIQIAVSGNGLAIFLYEPNPTKVRPYIYYNEFSGNADVDGFVDKGTRVAQYSFTTSDHDKRLVRVLLKGGLVQINDSTYDASGFMAAYKDLMKCNSKDL